MLNLLLYNNILAMNITFLMGNGFDINLGLNTRYRNFYDYYKKLPSNNTLIEELKKNIRNDYENWSDLEIALGKYTKVLNTSEEFDIVFEDIQSNLANYISEEENKFEYDIYNKNEVFRNFVYPESFLPLLDANTLKQFKEQWRSSSWSINILTFNYSRTIERIIDFKENMNLVTHHGNVATYLRNVLHIHGYTDKNMILGVNDISHIENENFKEHIDIVEAIIKPECNKVLKHLIDLECQNIIQSSQLLCIFGSSLGDTDRIWWEMIGNHLLTTVNSRLILFMRGDEIPVNQGYKINRQTRFLKRKFLSQTGLAEEEKDKIESKIFIGYNTNIFNIKLEKINIQEDSKHEITTS